MEKYIKTPIYFLFLLSGFGSLSGQPSNYDREWGTYDGDYTSALSSSTVDNDYNLYLTYLSPSGPFYEYAIIDKFSSTGELLFSISFKPDEASVYIDDIKLDHNQDLVICGWTDSPDIFGTLGAWQEENAGLYDRFLAKLDSKTGTVIWSTYFGGPANDEDGEDDYSWEHNSLIGITATNDIVWTTNMRSGNMGTSNVSQEERGANAANYVISMFDTGGQRVWTTYYGYDNSNISGMQVDDSGIYVAGQTGYNMGGTMNEAYFDTSNTYTVSSYQSDAYISKFDFTGNRLWSYYFGGNADEFIMKNALSLNGNKLYLSGFTYSSQGISSEDTFLPNIDNFTSSGFLVQFDMDGTYQWGTYLGEKLDYGNSFPGIFAERDAKNIYVAGYTTTSEGMATSSAFQQTMQGNSDAFVLEFSDTGQRVFGTYYGGENDENGLFTVLSPFPGGFYLAGMTNSETGISTSGAHQENYLGNSPDYADALFISKFVEAPLGVMDIGHCDNGFMLYPNPAKESIILQFNECINFLENYRGSIYNSLGQLIASFESLSSIYTLNISKFPPGIYHVRISKGNDTFLESFIKN